MLQKFCLDRHTKGGFLEFPPLYGIGVFAVEIEDQHENLISTLKHRQLLQEESLSHDRMFNS